MRVYVLDPLGSGSTLKNGRWKFTAPVRPCLQKKSCENWFPGKHAPYHFVLPAWVDARDKHRPKERGRPLKGKYCRLCKMTSTHLIPPQSRQVLKLFILLRAYWKTGDNCFQKLDAGDTYLNNSTSGALTPLMPAVLIVFHRIIFLKNGSKILVWNLVSFWAQHFPPKPAL